MPDVTYFPNVQTSFGENLLKHGANGSPLEHEEAIVSISEAREERRWTFRQMRDDASRVRAALEKIGVTSEDAVGAYLPNLGETILAMLGTTSTGAVWSSVSPDFGAQAVIDRFGQIKPKVLFTANGFVSKGESTSMVDKVEELVRALEVDKIVVIDLIGDGDNTKWSKSAEKLIVSWDDFLKDGSEEDGSAPKSEFTKVDFTHPQFVLYSSGTTGGK
jgi:acetoacetyl-CoA synthetase